MTIFRDTDEAARFVASGASRETSPEIMRAVVFFASDLDEAERLWANGPDDIICSATDFWEHVTSNGLRDPGEFCWGVSGTEWWNHIQANKP